jgi:hypothetical protein
MPISSVWEVNKHNVRIWESENPYMHMEHICDCLKVSVFCGTGNIKVCSPLFFMEGTSTGNVCLDMLQNVLIPQIDKDDLQEPAVFQQDGIPPHFHTDVQEFLNGYFPDCWVGRGEPIAWPHCSPDLMPLDFFL